MIAWNATQFDDEAPIASVATAASRYALAVELLKGCTLDELRQLQMTDLRLVQYQVGGVSYEPRPFPKSQQN
jgi:hypothetical protein